MTQDAQCRERFGVASRQRAMNNYTVEAMTKKMESVYLNAARTNVPQVALGEA
jgi:hypothetical protein